MPEPITEAPPESTLTLARARITVLNMSAFLESLRALRQAASSTRERMAIQPLVAGLAEPNPRTL
jgi:hypothetical protein